jgi:hypothetical protein
MTGHRWRALARAGAGMMELQHMDVHACTPMDEAAAWFGASADAGKPPDIVFMDMQLGDPRRVSVSNVQVYNQNTINCNPHRVALE